MKAVVQDQKCVSRITYIKIFFITEQMIAEVTGKGKNIEGESMYMKRCLNYIRFIFPCKRSFLFLLYGQNSVFHAELPTSKLSIHFLMAVSV